jgi:hypothetical protein
MCKTHSKPVNEMCFGGASDAKGGEEIYATIRHKKSRDARGSF